MKKKIVYIAPHLSTGGMPQYLYKQIELLCDTFEIYCIEWGDVTGGVLVVQRNKIKSILGDRLLTLGESKEELFDMIKRINPDVIHLQEIPELFIPHIIAEKLYTKDRKYTIIETSHDSSQSAKNKRFFPDKFLFVSQYQVGLYKELGIPYDIVEYPIEFFTRTKTREQAQKELGMNPNLKHIINVGLFTPRKNQAEIIEYAKSLKDQPFQFHFIGNQADNFRYYWEPIMKDFPPNCKWWNERTDVENFYQAADLFLFTSRGSEHDKETMPLVIREAISWQVPSLIYNLPVYENYFDKYENINYLDFESKDNNCQKIIKKLHMNVLSNSTNSSKKEIFIVSSYPNVENKEILLNNIVDNLKKLNKEILLISHYPVPDYIVEKADYYLYDSQNIKDLNRTLQKYGPDYWMDIEQFRIEAIMVNHIPSICRMFSLAFDFCKVLGYEKFTILESDSSYSKNDIKKLCSLTDVAINSDKKLWFCKPRYTQFTWNSSYVYEMHAFGGDLHYFTSIFKFPKDYTEWISLIEKYNNYCFEYIMYDNLSEYENNFLILDSMKNEFIESEIDLYSNNNVHSVYYNKNNEHQPIIFIYNNNECDEIETNIIIDGTQRKILLKRNNWWYDSINLNEKDNINVRIEKYINKELVSYTTQIVSKENIASLKSYKTIEFK